MIRRTGTVLLVGFLVALGIGVWPLDAGAAERPVPRLQAQHATAAVTDRNVVLDDRNQLMSLEIRQPDMPGPTARQLLVHLVSRITFDADGEVLLSASINSLAAVQIIARRSGSATSINILDLVDGSRIVHSTGRTVSIDAWNFAQEAAVRNDRSLLTLRAEPHGNRVVPPFRWEVLPQSSLISTAASPYELSLKLSRSAVRRDLGGFLVVPVTLHRRGGWAARPATVRITVYALPDDEDPSPGLDVTAERHPTTSANAVVGARRQAATVRVPAPHTGASRFEIRAEVVGSFNSPQDAMVAEFRQPNAWGLVLATFLAVAAVAVMFSAWWQHRRPRVVLPAIAIVMGAALGWIAYIDHSSVDALPSRIVHARPHAAGTQGEVHVLDFAAARRFDSATAYSGLAGPLRRVDAQLIEERIHRHSWVRVYEVDLRKVRAGAHQRHRSSQESALRNAIRHAGSGDRHPVFRLVMQGDAVNVRTGYR